jgi:oxalate decarboxylase
VDGGSYGKEATVEQLPISKGLAGVLMRVEPGVTRELHWHATAAEWAFVISGRCRTTVIDPAGNAETDDFDAGDVWYFPRGHGHSIACLGNTACEFVLIFDNGYFSEFGTFSITDWVGHSPKELISKSIGVPLAALDAFPKQEAYFVHGRIPPEAPAATHSGVVRQPPSTHRYRLLAQAPHSVHKGGTEWRVGADEFPISTTVTGIVLDMAPNAIRELHWHPTADEWQYLISGQVSVTLFGSRGRYRIETLNAGDVGYIPQGYGHSIENVGGTTARILIAFNTGKYQAIDLSQWLAGNPDYLLADHFNTSEAVVAQMPRADEFVVPM